MSTYQGIVYFIGCEKNGVVKIGATRSDTADARLSSIQTGCPFKVSVIAEIRCLLVDPMLVEADLHKIFSLYRLNGEWFSMRGLVSGFLNKMNMEYSGQLVATMPRANCKRKWRIGYSGIKDGYECLIQDCLESYKQGGQDSVTIKGLEILLEKCFETISHLGATVNGYEKAINGLMKFSEERQSSCDIFNQSHHGDDAEFELFKIVSGNYSKGDLETAVSSLSYYMNEDYKGFFESAIYPTEPPITLADA